MLAFIFKVILKEKTHPQIKLKKRSQEVLS